MVVSLSYSSSSVVTLAAATIAAFSLLLAAALVHLGIPSWTTVYRIGVTVLSLFQRPVCSHRVVALRGCSTEGAFLALKADG